MATVSSLSVITSLARNLSSLDLKGDFFLSFKKLSTFVYVNVLSYFFKSRYLNRTLVLVSAPCCSLLTVGSCSCKCCFVKHKLGKRNSLHKAVRLTTHIIYMLLE